MGRLFARIYLHFLGVLLVVILAVGHPQDALFGIVLVSNALIGIVQEVRAKRTLDQLAVLSEPRVRVVRDGEVSEVSVDNVVLDDLIELRSGDQIAADHDAIREVKLESLQVGGQNMAVAILKK